MRTSDLGVEKRVHLGARAAAKTGDREARERRPRSPASDWFERGEGCYDACRVRQVYRMKATGDFAYERQREIQPVVGNGRVNRYEMRIVG